MGFTPSHLKEHQLFGATVLVSYEERGDGLVAVKIEEMIGGSEELIHLFGALPQKYESRNYITY